MRHFCHKIAAAASLTILVALASAVPGLRIRAAGSEDGSVGTPSMTDHPMAGQDRAPVDAAPTMSGHDQMSGHDHMNMSPADGRVLVHFPPEMRMHMLRNMRDHVQTLDGILHALASAEYEDAAKIAI